MTQIPCPSNESEYYTPSEYRRVLDRMGFAVTYPKGSSMRPLIWEGAHYVVISKLDCQPAIGDILVFEQIRQKKTAYVVHRLVSIENTNGAIVYVTRGDNCLACERIREEDIIGKVSEVHRKGGWRPWHAMRQRQFNMDDKSYRRYTCLWDKTWGLRKRFYRFRIFLSKIKRKIA